MALSGTSSFNPDVSELIEEAYERAGLEMRSGYDLRTARRSLNFLLLEWANRGINLWTIDEVSLGLLTKGTASYDLNIDTIALLDVILRTDDASVANQMDYQLNRISQPTYATIPNKLSEARPLQYYLERVGIRDTSGTDTTDKIILWPVPDSSTKYNLRYWRIRRMDDAGGNAENTMEVPARFLPALVAGLAYQIATKRSEALQRAPMLKQQYEELFSEAADEDRVKTSARFVPRIGWI